MPQNNKSTAKSPFTPKPVVYAAWGLLAAALVAHFVPALETVALVLYAVGLIALCLLAMTAPKKGTIAAGVAEHPACADSADSADDFGETSRCRH